MSINAKQLRMLIVRHTLHEMDMWSPASENLVMGTCAQESHLGSYIKQLSNGPALGIYQMEPNTYLDVLAIVWPLYRNYSEWLKTYVIPNDPNALIYDLRLATVMCRLHYRRQQEPLPAYDDIIGLARYWKKYYNTEEGKGTCEEFIHNYRLTEA